MALTSLLLFSLAIAQGEPTIESDCDADSFLQVNSVEETSPASSSWQSPADLASLPRPQRFSLTEKVGLTIISAIPTFGADGNHIALVPDPVLRGGDHTASDALEDYLHQNPIFCTGPGGSHKAQLQWTPAHTYLLCDWPAKEAKAVKFEVFLQDAKGKALGNLIVQHKPLAKKYGTMACMRDIFVDTNPHHVSEVFSGPFKQLVEWLEFHHLHGVDHFLLYTFQGADEASKEVFTPYLRDGVASRVHFEHYPASVLVRQHYIIRDCLFRAKNHADWLLPSVDVDEFVHITGSSMYPHGKVPQDYLRTAWDAFIKHQKQDSKKIQAIKFDRCRFARGAPEQLDISSVWRESGLQEERGSHARALPKYACNVHLAMDPHIHSTKTLPGTSLKAERDMIIANHYRSPKGKQEEYGEKFTQLPDPLASVKDEALLPSVALVEEALRKRFREDPRLLLKRFSEKRPPSMEDAARLSASFNESAPAHSLLQALEEVALQALEEAEADEQEEVEGDQEEVEADQQEVEADQQD